MNQVTGLIHFNRARQELQKAKTIDEVKTIRDAAERLRMYLKQSKESLEMQNDAAEIRLRAERKAGEMLKEAAEKGERARPGNNQHQKGSDAMSPPPNLEEVGITRKQSSRWQSIAAIPEDIFEQVIRETKEANREPTQRALLKVIREIRGEAPGKRHKMRCESISSRRCSIWATTKKQSTITSLRRIITFAWPDSLNNKHSESITCRFRCRLSSPKMNTSNRSRDLEKLPWEWLIEAPEISVSSLRWEWGPSAIGMAAGITRTINAVAIPLLSIPSFIERKNNE